MLIINIEGKRFEGLLDTGADRSIISRDQWPSKWPVQHSSQTLQGLGYASEPAVSAKELTWFSEEGHQGKFQPYVVQVPVNLWGRDLLTKMDLRLTNDYSKQSRHMMNRMGYQSGRGLGAQLQGRCSPIKITEKHDKKGLGFS